MDNNVSTHNNSLCLIIRYCVKQEYFERIMTGMKKHLIGECGILHVVSSTITH